MKEIRNERGIFTVTDSGVLCGFSYIPHKGWNFDGERNRLGGLFITDLDIPEGVRVLPENAFRGYEIINSVILPESCEVRDGAFSRCILKNLIMPKKIRLGSNVFSGSGISHVCVPENADSTMMRQLAHALRFCLAEPEGWPEEYENIYRGKSEPREKWVRISNSSGTFWVDSDGVLMDFYCDGDNRERNGSGKEMFRLHIPEGVEAIPSEMFCRYTVLWEMSLPKSLRFIGGGNGVGINTFASCHLPDVILPEKLELFGNFAFGACKIRSLTIPGSIKESYSPCGMRQFKDCRIGEIRVPIEYRDILEEVYEEERNVSLGEMTDPRLGRLYCAKAPGGSLGWGDVVLGLLNAFV